jgi:hypothetical protein
MRFFLLNCLLAMRSNADLNVRIEKLNIASSSVDHVSICNRCKDIDVDACNSHASTISKLNDVDANPNAQLKICKNECEKIKFARDAYTIGRHPSIKDGLGFQKGTKNLPSQRASNLIKEKGKTSLPLASSSHSFHDKKNHAYLYAHVKNTSNVAHHDGCYGHAALPIPHDVVFDSHAMFTSSSSSYVHGRSRPRCHVDHVVSHAPRNASNSPTMLYRTYDAAYVLNCKNDKVVARNVGSKCKRGKTCIWVPKSYVTNLVGPNKSWVPKSQALTTLQVYASGGTSWIIDSGCTNLITGEKKMFTSVTPGFKGKTECISYVYQDLFPHIC